MATYYVKIRAFSVVRGSMIDDEQTVDARNLKHARALLIGASKLLADKRLLVVYSATIRNGDDKNLGMLTYLYDHIGNDFFMDSVTWIAPDKKQYNVDWSTGRLSSK